MALSHTKPCTAQHSAEVQNSVWNFKKDESQLKKILEQDEQKNLMVENSKEEGLFSSAGRTNTAAIFKYRRTARKENVLICKKQTAVRDLKTKPSLG